MSNFDHFIGTRAVSEQHAFDTAALSAWLQQNLARPKQKVILTRFEPSVLPLVVVPDREIELKERVEKDNADRWLSQTALSLARMYTNSIDGSVDCQLYVNAGSPAIEQLIQCRTLAPEAAGRAAQMLKVLAGLLENSISDTGSGNFQETLKLYTDLICNLLPEKTTAASRPSK